MARGGARENSGGKRAGAGRKPVIHAPLPASPIQQTPLDFLLATMRDEDADPRIRLEAAKAAAAYLHPKACEIGVKDQRNVAAKKAASGKFATPLPPATILPFPR